MSFTKKRYVLFSQEYLTQLGQLLVKQKVEALEAIIGFETVNKVRTSDLQTGGVVESHVLFS